MKTKYINTPGGEAGSRGRGEFRDTARMHLFAFLEAMKARPVKPQAVGFKPGSDSERGYMFLSFSACEEVRFYISPGSDRRYVCDKIDFAYIEDNAGVLFEMTPEPWARALFADLERTGAVNDHIARVQAVGAN
jgi:hypothetical protein